MTTWTCPKCGARNEDDESATALLMCEQCGESIEWWEIEADADAQSVLDEQNSNYYAGLGVRQ